MAMLSVVFFLFLAACLAAALPGRDVFFLLHSEECEDQRDLTSALVEADVLQADEKEGFSAQLVAHAEAHGRRRLGLETLYGRGRKLHEMSLLERRDHTIAALDLIVQRTQHPSFSNFSDFSDPDNSMFEASASSTLNKSVSTSFLSALGIDIISNSRLPNNELFAISSSLPCLDAPPEMDTAKTLLVNRNEWIPNEWNDFDRTGNKNWHLMGPDGAVNKEPYGIDATSAWECYTGQNGPVIGVVDSGCSMHPDLEQNMCKPGDDCAGYDFGDDDDNPHDEALGRNTHGTGTAGIMAASTNNNYGLAGVCWGCRIMCLKIHNSETDKVPTSAAISAIDYMLKKNVKISNHSYGGYGNSPAELRGHQKLRDAGHIAVVAAGNDACNIDKPNSRDPDGCKFFGMSLGPARPSTYDVDTMITVGAITRRGDRASFSNVGKIHVDLFAPGKAVVVPWNTRRSKDGTAVMEGTSFSSPIVAGAVGLIWGYNPNLTALQVKKIISDNVDKRENIEPHCKTGGTLNIGKAIKSMGLPCNAPKVAVMPKPRVDNTLAYYAKPPKIMPTKTPSTTVADITTTGTEAPEVITVTPVVTKASTIVEAAGRTTSSSSSYELCRVSVLFVSILFVSIL